jgi:hypothetical protein
MLYLADKIGIGQLKMAQLMNIGIANLLEVDLRP